jgi:tetratricopeptide (TPR) repeat protein
MKRAVLLGMIGACVLGWCVTAKTLIEKPMEYHRLIAEAEEYEADKIYIRAIDSYKKALTYNPNSVNIQTRIATDYLALGDESSFVNKCNAINDEHKYPVSVVTLLSDYYMENKRNEQAIELLTKALKQHKNEEALQERYDKLKYTYKQIYVSYDEILPFRNDSTVYVNDGYYGLMDVSGKSMIRNHNEWNGVLSGDRESVPMLKNGEFYYADSNGYRIEVPKKDQKVESLGIICNDIAPAKINGKYGYINVKFEEQSPFEWDGATVIQNGFGAVQKDGKWALIDKSFQQISDYIYDDVKTDVYGYCSISGRAFVKTGNSYQMVNDKGELIGEGGYEDAVPFVAEEPTAVMKNGKWGFVDLDGQMVIEPQYENAGAFNGGLAPVQTGSGWGYITMDNQLVIDADFSEAGSFYKGVAPVKTGNSWTMIELNVK